MVIRLSNIPVNVVIIALCTIFTGKVLFLAFKVSPGAPPDEMYHLQMVDAHARSEVLFPLNGSSSPFARPLEKFSCFGQTAEYPLLYHFLLGRLISALNRDTFDFSSIIILRLCSLALACATIIAFMELSHHYLRDPPERALVLAILTNILSFTLLSGSVSYDPPANLMAVLSLHALLRFVKNHRLQDLIWLSLWLSVGILLKLTILPLAAIFVTVGAASYFFKAKREYPESPRAIPRKDWAIIPLTLTSTIWIVAATAYLSGLYLKYGTLKPTCPQIFSAVQCAQYLAYEAPPADQVPIQHTETLSLPGYSIFWTHHMISSALGIRSHVGLAPSPTLVAVLELMVLGCLIWALVECCRGNRIWGLLVLIIISYSVFIMVFQGYPAYRFYHNYSIKMNGRYIFPVLAPLLLVVARALSCLLRSVGRPEYWFLIVLSVVLLEFPVTFSSSAGRNFIKPWPREFYQLLGCSPLPSYDKHFNRLN